MLNKTLKDSQAGSVIMSVIVLEDWEEQQMDLCILIKYHIFVMAWWKPQQYSSFGWFNAILSLWLVPIKPAISERIINFSWRYWTLDLQSLSLLSSSNASMQELMNTVKTKPLSGSSSNVAHVTQDERMNSIDFQGRRSNSFWANITSLQRVVKGIQ